MIQTTKLLLQSLLFTPLELYLIYGSVTPFDATKNRCDMRTANDFKTVRRSRSAT